MKHLVMLGAGHAHLHLLSTLAAQPLASVQITLVAPYPQPLVAGMVPGFVAGYHTLQDCVIPIESFAKNPAVTWVQRHTVGLDVMAGTVTLDNGSTLAYDVLSINRGPVLDKQKTEQMMPGAREHALFALPLEPLGALWPKVLELAQQKPLRFAVIGGGATGFELACAVAHRLPASSVTLLSGDAAVGANYPAAVQSMMLQALKARAITVIQERVVGIGAGEVTLASGARLACDVPIIAISAQAPEWLGSSGLALDTQGFVAVDAFLRSTSHPQVFTAGDMATRVDPNLALIKNLRAVLAGIQPSPCAAQARPLNFLSCGNHCAIVSWGNWSAQGQWVGWLKDWTDRRFIKSYRVG